jgi:hypothetical protein
MAQDIKTGKRTLTPRCCRYCRVKFVPARPQDKDARFCCPNHRKAYWRYGGLRFDKFKMQLIKELKGYVREEVQRCQTMPASDLDPWEEISRFVRAEMSRLLASLGQSTP